jgi:hypothetical protein
MALQARSLAGYIWKNLSMQSLGREHHPIILRSHLNYNWSNLEGVAEIAHSSQPRDAGSGVIGFR